MESLLFAMSVWFRVDASQRIGVGHLMRCLALAQAFDDQDIDVFFVVRDDTRSICLSRHDWVGRILVIPEEISLHQEVDWLANQVDFMAAEAVILDGYQFDAEYRQQMSQLSPRFVLFDDTNDSGELFADVVINSADTAEKLKYEKTAPQAELCLGPEYRVLRREFVSPSFSHKQPRHSLSIVMGGSDVKNVTIALLKGLDKVSFEGPVRVMTGAAYPYLPALEDFISHSHLSIQHLPNCQQVADVFNSSKLVVSAAGSSQFELLACATPAILLTVADNQALATAAAEKQGWCVAVDIRERLALDELLNQIVSLWDNEEILQDMSDKAMNIGHANSDNGYKLVETIFRRG